MSCCTIIPVVPPLDRHVGPCCNVTVVCWCVVPARVCLCFPPHLGATKPPTHREVSPQPRSPFLFVDPQKIKTTQMQRAYTRERPRLHVDRHLREHRCTGQSRAGWGPWPPFDAARAGAKSPVFSGMLRAQTLERDPSAVDPVVFFFPGNSGAEVVSVVGGKGGDDEEAAVKFEFKTRLRVTPLDLNLIPTGEFVM